MCECYQIGGRFIAEDPDCPIHGTEARAADRERQDERAEILGQLADLRAEVERLKTHAVVLANTERQVERERWTEAVMAELDGNGQAHAIVAYATRA